jgi:hypothetical protein
VLSKEPTGGFAAIACSIEVDSDSTADALYAKYLSGAQSDLVLAFTGTGNNALSVTVQNGFMEGSAPFNMGAGPITQSFRHRGRERRDGPRPPGSWSDNDNSSSTAN